LEQWVATTGCMSADCRAARLFDATGSIDSGVSTNLTYHSGSVSGEIMWEAVTMSIFSIAYQAFGQYPFGTKCDCSEKLTVAVASSDVVNQNLDGGEYSGILGLARVSYFCYHVSRIMLMGTSPCKFHHFVRDSRYDVE
jgi:hypothetical protein